MPPLRLAVPAALVVLLLAGCRVPVKTDYDPSVDLGGLASFAWLDPPLREKPGEGEPADPFVHNTLLDKRVRDAVERELVARGYRPAGDEPPDFLVRYHVVARQKTRERPVVVGGGFGYGRYPFGYGSSVAYGSESYEEGTLILDVIDPASESIAWRGWAAARARDGYFDAERVDRYVQAILARFPPPVQ
jgi:hypothetical protein